MSRTVIDPCLFVLIAGSFVIKAGTHVDDFLFTTNDVNKFEEWFANITRELQISSKSRVGMEGLDYMALWITYNSARSYLKISQHDYIKNALKLFGLEKMKSAATPMATGVKFTRADMPATVDIHYCVRWNR